MWIFQLKINIIEICKIDDEFCWIEFIALKKFFKTMILMFKLTIFFDIWHEKQNLHERHVIHRDLKPENILLKIDYKLKITFLRSLVTSLTLIFDIVSDKVFENHLEKTLICCEMHSVAMCVAFICFYFRKMIWRRLDYFWVY